MGDRHICEPHSLPLRFGTQEAHVERDVVGDDRQIPDELGEARQRELDGIAVEQEHVVGDAGEPRDEVRKRLLDPNQRVKRAARNSALRNTQRGNFDDAAAASTVKQLFAVGTGWGIVYDVWDAYGHIEHLTPEAVPAAHAAKQQLCQLKFDAINKLHEPVAWLSMAVLAVFLLTAWRRRTFATLEPLAATIGAALLANAFVCGALSNPHDRYGAPPGLDCDAVCCGRLGAGAASPSRRARSAFGPGGLPAEPQAVPVRRDADPHGPPRPEENRRSHALL